VCSSDLVDASNLERNLYLAVQIMEMGKPFILVLNMMDEANAKRYKIDTATISREMCVPVIPMIAHKNEGTKELLAKITDVAENKTEASGVKIEYGREIDNELNRLEQAMSENPLACRYSSRWLAIKLLEGDEEVIKKFQEAKSV
jgi:ferrous iron transport protein B